MKLTDQHKKILDEAMLGIYIEPSDLESAKWDSNIYGVEPQYAVGGWVYDEDEYYNKQIEEAIEMILADGIGAYFYEVDQDDNSDDEELEKEAIEYLGKKMR